MKVEEKNKLEKLKARQTKQNEYLKEKYDRINITVPKGQKEIIQAVATSKGMTINKYINNLIINDIGDQK